MGDGRKWRWKLLAGIAVVLSATILLAAVGCGGREEKASSGTGEGSLENGGETGLSLLPEEVSTQEPASISTAEGTGASTLPELQARVIRNGQVKMEAERGGYAKIREDAVALVTAAGGYVQDESSRRDDEGLVHATLTLRVPAEAFDRTMTDISALGKIISSQVNTSDVSAEYVDLEARLRHLQAEEAFYLSLIGQAKTVQEMVTIREHLSSVQLEKERVQGRMNFLDRQVQYSTLTLSVDEVGPGEAGGFWDSVGRAFRAFARGMRVLALGIFYALPWLVLAALIYLVVHFLLRGRKKRSAEG
ncbi:DUF4349 domain-containing protein [Candidatus Solincola sp.]|jgi:hypothetical protein|nr:DUF4349 domain-containing protein [Actinomycetota bacterium]